MHTIFRRWWSQARTTRRPGIGSLMPGVAFSFALALPLAAYADPFDSHFDRIQTATWHGDVAALSALGKELNTAAESNDPQAVYAAAYADYRLAGACRKQMKQCADAVDTALDRAESRLRTLGESATPYQAEALALLSTIYGLKIARSPIKGMLLGNLAGNAIDRAAKLAPDNPRVLLLKGVAKLNTPGFFGGDRDAAIQAFDAAIERLPRDRFTATNWGLDDAYVWRGIALKSAGRLKEAQASFERALQVAPEQEWARELLSETNRRH